MIQLVRRLSNWLSLMSRLPDIEAMKKEGNISTLKQALEHPVAKVRWAATRALGDLWRIPDLAKLGHPDSKIRASAAEVLGQSRDYRVMAPLIAALHDPVVSYTDELNRSVYPVRISAISALCEIGDPIAIDPLLEALSGESWYGQTLGFQGKLGENLVKMGSPMLLRCIALLQSPDVMTRQQAIYVLECFDAPQTVEPLGQFLMYETQNNLRAAALRIICSMEDNLAVPTLVVLLQQVANPAHQEELVISLSKFDNKCIIPVLVDALQKAEPPWLDGMRNYISKFGTPAAKVALAEFQEEVSNLPTAPVPPPKKVHRIEVKIPN